MGGDHGVLAIAQLTHLQFQSLCRAGGLNGEGPKNKQRDKARADPNTGATAKKITRRKGEYQSGNEPP